MDFHVASLPYIDFVKTAGTTDDKKRWTPVVPDP
jgi:hypothetical protein